jgi:hypothetical protein
MTVIAHQERKHSKLGPSAAHRWMHCTGSVRLSRTMPNKSTVFAREGTAAHEFIEFIMRTGHDSRSFLGGLIDLSAPPKGERFQRDTGEHADREQKFAIDEEMVEGAELTQEVIAEYFDEAQGDILMLETKLDMSFIHPELFGTGDMIVYQPRTGRLIVLDYKYGRGVAVDVEDNEQVLTYAVGAIALMKSLGHRVESLTCVIIQPRAYHIKGPVRRDDVDLFDLIMFEDLLREKAAETDDPNAALVAGEQCKFCPAAHACEHLAETVLETLGVEDKGVALTEDDMPRLIQMDKATMGRIARNVALIEGWLKRFMAYAHDEALKGNVPEGMKMVDKRAYRKFTVSEGDIIAILDLEGIGEEEAMTDPELRSVAQIEKIVGKKAFAKLFAGSFKKESSGYVLALEDDARDAVKIDKSDSFGAVDD